MDNRYYEKSASEKGASAAIIDVLYEKKLIDWHSFYPTKTPLGYDDTYPPFIQWSFRGTDETTERKVISLIEGFPSELNWVVKKLPNHKWRLTIREVWLAFEDNSEYLPVDASCVIKEKNPSLGICANEEALRIAAYLDEML